MPAKRVIVLERLDTPGLAFRVALWADVPAARQSFYANAAKSSAWITASTGEVDALRTGQVVERVDTVTFPAGTTAAQAQPTLEGLWTDYQAQITGANPWGRYGTYWAGDGAAWVAGGVS